MIDKSTDKVDKLERIPELPNEFNLNLSSLDSPDSPTPNDNRKMKIENNEFDQDSDLNESDAGGRIN